MLEAEEDHCAIRRDFGAPDGSATTLAFQPTPNADSMQLFVLSADPSSQRAAGKATISIGSGGRTITAPYTSGVIPNKSLRLTTIALDHDVLVDLKEGDTLSVTAAPIERGFVVTGVGKAEAALQNCTTTLLKSWGVEASNELSSRPSLAGNPGSFFGYDHYPEEAVRKHVQGRVVLVLSIDASGAVQSCKVVASPNTLLNDGSCRTAMRARFNPGRNKTGEAVASTYILPVRWVLPGN